MPRFVYVQPRSYNNAYRSHTPRYYDDSYYDRRPIYHHHSAPRYYDDSYLPQRSSHHSSHYSSWKPKSHSKKDWGYTGSGGYNGDLERFSRKWPSYSQERSATKYGSKAVAYTARSAFKATGADMGLGVITAGLQGLGWGVTKGAEFLFCDDKPRHRRR